jgi:glycosyltransferase involved in cell wall biosynthesis
MRITHYLPTIRLADGGVARVVLDWCSLFARRGHTVTLLCHEATDVPADWLGDPGLPKCLLVPRTARGLLTSAMEKTVLRQTDVLHLHAPWEIANVHYARSARRLGVPYAVSIHGMLDDWSMAQRSAKKRLYLALAGRKLLNRAAVIHCSAAAELAQAKKWFNNPRTAVLPCIADLSPFEQLPGPEAGLQRMHLPSNVPMDSPMCSWPKVLFLSRLHEKKGVDVLIRCAGMLRDAGTDVLTLIAGTGDAAYEQQLRNLVQQQNLSDRVVFMGLVTGTTKISLLQAVDLLALPTQQENFGLVLTEAMASGTAVLTTRGTDIWREIQSAGAVITDRTPEAFATAIAKLLKDAADRLDRGKRGREWVFSALAAGPLCQKYEAMYRGMIASGRS